jgi:hypothetical protein
MKYIFQFLLGPQSDSTKDLIEVGTRFSMEEEEHKNRKQFLKTQFEKQMAIKTNYIFISVSQSNTGNKEM